MGITSLISFRESRERLRRLRLSFFSSNSLVCLSIPFRKRGRAAHYSSATSSLSLLARVRLSAPRVPMVAISAPVIFFFWVFFARL